VLSSNAVQLSRISCAKLWLRVQLDAFRFNPAGYVQALAWRARGLRVRSRNQLAALAGRSPWAYRYWTACKEPHLRRVSGSSQWTGDMRIIPVIDCRRSAEHLSETLASIPSHCTPILIGHDAGVAAISIARPRDLAAVLPEGEPWICPIACGDRFAAGALQEYSRAAAELESAGIIYADDDLIDDQAQRREPHFKPDWNPELFQHHDFISGASILPAARGHLESLPDDGWAEALVKIALGESGPAAHLRQVLHHRRSRPDPVIPPKPAVPVGANAPTVTIIIPTRNATELLRACIEGVQRTEYPRFDIIIVDNDSDEPESLTFLRELRSRGIAVLKSGGSFNFSALNNFAVARAKGELLCFLNNDVEVIEPDWLALLVRQAVRPDVGAVGARLLYPDGTVQHAGVYTGIGGGAAHAHRFQEAEDRGYFERARLPQRVSAVTAACLVVAKERFQFVGGFDEESFAVAFNDVDLCLRLNQAGWQSFYEPRATLIHHESRSRGSDREKANRTRFANELTALKRKWGTDVNCDPFHHPHLSRFCEDFLVAVD
jgi:O-antigen biosynthesis protein